MRDLQTLQELASNQCLYCEAEFTPDNPCYNCEAIVLVNGQDLHVDGECKRCAEIREHNNPVFRPTAQHERGE